MADLYPTFDVPDYDDENKKPQENPYSMFFDYDGGDFTQMKTGEMIQATPEEAWVQWCIKAVRTQRGALYAYAGYNYGADIESAMKKPTRETRESALQRTISEALLADPYKRTVSVRNFKFAWSADSVAISCDISGKWSNTQRIEVALPQ